MTLTFTVPIPPSTNHLYATVNGRRVLSKLGRRYKDDVGWQARAAAVEQVWTVPERLALTVRLYFPNRQRTDIDNRIKILLDSLSESLHFDDCRIDRLLVERAGIDRQNPRAEIVIAAALAADGFVVEVTEVEEVRA